VLAEIERIVDLGTRRRTARPVSASPPQNRRRLRDAAVRLKEALAHDL